MLPLSAASGPMLTSTWNILCESAIFILAGFLIAGFLEIALSGDWFVRFVSENRKRSVFLATLIGVPLPLCSCGVLPAAMTLQRKGASKGATLSFLISTPETSVTSILLTYSLMGPLLAVFRPIAACITALITGLIENTFQQRVPEEGRQESDEETAAGCDSCCARPADDVAEDSASALLARLRKAMKYAFVDLFDDIFGWVLIGVLAAAVIQAFLPPDVVGSYLGGPLQSMLLMVVIGVPLYVCAESSTPIAAVLLAQGMNPGAALVFLLVGPATNIGAVGVLRERLGKRTVVVYLATIVVVAIVMGGLLNVLLSGLGVQLETRALGEPLVPEWLKVAGAVTFLVLGLGSVRRLRWMSRLAAWLDARLPIHVKPPTLGVFVLLLLALTYFGSGLFMVRPGEVGIVRRLGTIHRADVRPGLHYRLPYPIDQLDRVRVDCVQRLVIGFLRDERGELTETASPRESWNLTGDENIADLKLAVHWAARKDDVIRFQYGVADRELLVRDVVLAAAREVFARRLINRVFTGQRMRCEREIEQLAQHRLDEYRSGIRIESFFILDAHAPPEVHAAFRDVASALEDRSTMVNRAKAHEAREIPQARGEAAQRLAEAEGYHVATVRRARGEADRFLSLLGVYQQSPEVTGLRLQLEMLEDVLPKLRKYIKPPSAGADELEIWFVQPEAQRKMSLESEETSPTEIRYRGGR
jgi:HflK protein